MTATCSQTGSSSTSVLSSCWSTPALGALALGLYSVHGGYHVSEGHPEQLLWACHIGNIAVGVGLLTRCRWLNAVGVLILAVGLPLWLINVCCGGRFIVTSPLMHVGGLAIGLVGLVRLGLPEDDKWKALGILAVIISFCRLLTSPDPNINLAFRSWGPLQNLPVPPQFHLTLLLAQWSVLLAVAEFVVRRAMRRFSVAG